MYKQFMEELYQNVKEQNEAEGKTVQILLSGEKYDAPESIGIIRKINFVRYGRTDNYVREDVLVVFGDGAGLSDMRYWFIRELYERFIKGGWQNVLPGIMVLLQEEVGAPVKSPARNENYEQSRYQHILRPFNYYSHREELENCIYWRQGDIALVLYIIICDMPGDFMSLKCNRGMAEKWGLSDEMVLTNALLNSRTLMPPRLYHGDMLRRELGSNAGIFMPGDGMINIFPDAQDELEGVQGYRLTTSKWVNGAVALFYPCVMRQLAEMMGGDYYVGFTSIHEAVIHPVRYKILNEMKAAILHTNAVCEETEMLTNCVYRYCSVKDMLLEV